MNKQKHYNELKSILKQANYQYHKEGNSQLSDLEYDIKFQELLEIEKQNPNWIRNNSPSQQVGQYIVSKLKKHTHNDPMLSLENIFNFQQLTKFNEKITKELKVENIEYCCEPKIDGLALSLIYNQNKLQVASTRGDGKIGENVTHNIIFNHNIPNVLLNIPNNLQLEIRGEIFLTKENFNKLNNNQNKNKQKQYSNPRNSAAGSLRLLSAFECKKRNLSFIAYQLIQNSETIKTWGKLNYYQIIEKLNSLGFITPKNFIKVSNIEQIENFYQKLQKKRNSLSYQIDGMVIKLNDYNYQQQLGFATRFPKWAIAYKFTTQTAITKLNDIKFQIGRMGTITPVAKLEPIDLSGIVIKNATLHNFDEIDRLDLRIGDLVEIKRAGEVIPQIVKTFKDKRTGNEKKLVKPQLCPICNSKIIYSIDKVKAQCSGGINCPAQKAQKIEHFVSKEAINIDGMGGKIIAQLIDKKLINKFEDIYRLDKQTLINNLNNFKEKSTNNLINSIEKNKNTTLDRFIYSQGILGVGQQTSINLAKHYKNLNSFLTTNLAELQKVENIGLTSAQNIYDFLNQKTNRNSIDQLAQILTITELKPIEVTNNSPYFNKNIVITGILTKPRIEYKNYFLSKGAKIKDSVNQKTDFVLIGDNPGSKYDKAIKLSIKIIKEEDL